LNSKPYLVVFVSAFGLIIISAVIGNIFESEGVITVENIGLKGIESVMHLYFLLFIIMVFSLVPLVIRIFIYLQIPLNKL